MTDPTNIDLTHEPGDVREGLRDDAKRAGLIHVSTPAEALLAEVAARRMELLREAA